MAGRRSRGLGRYTKAGPVVIRRPDGTTEKRPPYTVGQLKALGADANASRADRPSTRGPAVIRARRGGRCADCGERIKKGNSIRWHPVRRLAVHARCRIPPSTETP